MQWTLENDEMLSSVESLDEIDSGLGIFIQNISMHAERSSFERFLVKFCKVIAML